MKVLCSQKSLSAALRTASHAVPTGGTTLPILNNVRLAVTDGRLQVSATNLEIAITLSIDATIEEEGAITVPAKLLSSYVATLPAAQMVTLSTKDNTLIVQCGSQKSNMKTLPADEFPLVSDPAKDSTLLIELSSVILREMIDRSAGAASRDIQGTTAGVYCHRDAEGFHAVGLDSFRLAHTLCPDETNGEPIEVLIPAIALKSAYGALPSEEMVTRFLITPNSAFFVCDDLHIMMRLLAGKYPNYAVVGKHETITTATFNREEMIDALELAALFVEKQTSKPVQIRLRETAMQIGAEDADLGSVVSSVKAQITGPLVSMRFNTKYLLYALKNVSDETITTNIHDANKAVVIPTATCTHIVMPLVTTTAASPEEAQAEPITVQR